MQKLQNPFLNHPGYNCFGCNPSNSIGLGMTFFEEGEKVFSLWEPRAEYQGFTDVLHGGIQATLMDELASWFVFVKLKTSGMTKSINVSYREPVYISRGTVTLTAELVEKEKRSADILVTLRQGEGEPKSDALCTYALFAESVAKRKLHYPGVDAFYPRQRNAEEGEMSG